MPMVAAWTPMVAGAAASPLRQSDARPPPIAAWGTRSPALRSMAVAGAAIASPHHATPRSPCYTPLPCYTPYHATPPYRCCAGTGCLSTLCSVATREGRGPRPCPLCRCATWAAFRPRAGITLSRPRAAASRTHW
eukprot:scaffold64275_cov63-Phaeocystis_antarctica.AAC.3